MKPYKLYLNLIYSPFRKGCCVISAKLILFFGSSTSIFFMKSLAYSVTPGISYFSQRLRRNRTYSSLFSRKSSLRLKSQRVAYRISSRNRSLQLTIYPLHMSDLILLGWFQERCSWEFHTSSSFSPKRTQSWQTVRSLPTWDWPLCPGRY